MVALRSDCSAAAPRVRQTDDRELGSLMLPSSCFGPVREHTAPADFALRRGQGLFPEKTETGEACFASQ